MAQRISKGNFQVFVVRPPDDWNPRSAGDVPDRFTIERTEMIRVGLGFGIHVCQRFNSAEMAGDRRRWAILVRAAEVKGGAA